MLIAVVMFIDGILSLFLQVSISGVILLTEANISRLDLRLVQVAQGLVHVCFCKLISLNAQRGLPYAAKVVIILVQANILLATMYISLN